MAAKKKPSPAMQFVLDYLEKKPESTYAEVAEAASGKRLKIFPIMYGRAQTLLGHIPMSPRGKGKATRKKKPSPSLPSAPPRNKGATPTIDSLESIVAAMRQSEQEREKYKRALQEIGKILDSVQ